MKETTTRLLPDDIGVIANGDLMAGYSVGWRSDAAAESVRPRPEGREGV
jgi:hypothetical protein